MSNDSATVFQEQDGFNVLFVHSALDDAGLSVHAFRAYCHLARRANKRSEAWPGMESMAKKCQFSRSTAKRAILELEQRGFLEVQRTTGGLHTNRYMLTEPKKWKELPDEMEPGSQGTGSNEDVDPVHEEPGSQGTGFTENCHPVHGEPPPGSQRTAKVLHKGNPSKKKPVATDEEWITSLEADATYQHLEIRVELGKMQRWCEVKGKQPTRARFVNWINRIEKPIKSKANATHNRSDSANQKGRYGNAA